MPKRKHCTFFSRKKRQLKKLRCIPQRFKNKMKNRNILEHHGFPSPPPLEGVGGRPIATISGCGSIILKHFGHPSFPLSLGRWAEGEAFQGEAKKGGPHL